MPYSINQLSEVARRLHRLENPERYYRPNRGQTPFHLSRARFEILFAGNRFGKTTAGLMEDAMAMRGLHWVKGKYRIPTLTNPFRLRITGKPDAMAEVIQPMLRSFLPASTEIVPRAGNMGFDRRWLCRGKNWSSIVSFKSNNQEPEEMESVPQDLIHVDEGLTYRQYWANRTRLGVGEDYKMRMVFTLTPHDMMAWMDGILYTVGNDGSLLPLDDVDIFFGSLWDNAISLGGYIPDKEVSAMDEEAKRDPVMYEAVINGKPLLTYRSIFPMFDERIHVFNPNNISTWRDGVPVKGTLYIAMDPHDARPDFVQFWVVTPDGRHWLLDEFPNFYYGEFSGSPYERMRHRPLPLNVLARTIIERARHIRLEIGGCAIDPYFGAKPFASRDWGKMNVMDELNDALRLVSKDFPAFSSAPSLDNGLGEIAAGHALIRRLLYWNKERPVDETNRPGINYSKFCRNTTQAMKGYRLEKVKDKEGGMVVTTKPEELFKHAIDPQRYYLSMNPVHRESYKYDRMYDPPSAGCV